MKCSPLIVIALFAFVSAAASAQTPSSPTASGTSKSEPARTTGAATGAPTIINDGAPAAGAASGAKTCAAAERKLEREQKSLDRAQAEVARYDKLQKSCSTKSACARYISALESLEKRVARHQRRIEKFTATRKTVCKT